MPTTLIYQSRLAVVVVVVVGGGSGSCDGGFVVVAKSFDKNLRLTCKE